MCVHLIHIVRTWHIELSISFTSLLQIMLKTEVRYLVYESKVFTIVVVKMSLHGRRDIRKDAPRHGALYCTCINASK